MSGHKCPKEVMCLLLIKLSHSDLCMWRWVTGSCETWMNRFNFSKSAVWIGAQLRTCCLLYPRFERLQKKRKEAESEAQRVARLGDWDSTTTHRCTCTVDKGREECQRWITGLSLSLISPESRERAEDSWRRHWIGFFTPNPEKAQTLYGLQISVKSNSDGLIWMFLDFLVNNV